MSDLNKVGSDGPPVITVAEDWGTTEEAEKPECSPVTIEVDLENLKGIIEKLKKIRSFPVTNYSSEPIDMANNAIHTASSDLRIIINRLESMI